MHSHMGLKSCYNVSTISLQLTYRNSRIYSNKVLKILLMWYTPSFTRLLRFCPFDKGSRAPNLLCGYKICFTLDKNVLLM